MEKVAQLLDNLVIGHPLNQRVFGLIKHHPSGEVKGMTEPLGVRWRAGCPPAGRGLCRHPGPAAVGVRHE